MHIKKIVVTGDFQHEPTLALNSQVSIIKQTSWAGRRTSADLSSRLAYRTGRQSFNSSYYSYTYMRKYFIERLFEYVFIIISIVCKRKDFKTNLKKLFLLCYVENETSPLLESTILEEPFP